MIVAGLRAAAIGAFALLALGQTHPANAETVTVFAAASLKNALDDIGGAFERASGHDVTIAFAGSSTLARQIQQGAPADIFISANPAWMDILARDGLIVAETRFDLTGNRLALIAYDAALAPFEIGPDMDLADRLGSGRLAMALVNAVPAGIYGKAALTALGQWAAIAPKLAQTDNVRAALALVATGEAPFGIVYATDAAASNGGVAVVGLFPTESHPPIVYPAAAIAPVRSAAILALLAFLASDDGQARLQRHGFVKPTR